MKKSSLSLLLLHVVAVLMWAGAFAISNRSCPNGSCGDAGLILVPFFIPPLLATIAAAVTDITYLAKRFTPVKYGQTVSWLVPALLLGMPALWLIFAILYNAQKDHYSAQKAVDAVVACKASALGGYGSNPYVYLKTDPVHAITVTGGASARIALVNAAQNNADICGYDISKFELPAH